jgi:16S rRNA G966 N2-methylase RsmD
MNRTHGMVALPTARRMAQLSLLPPEEDAWALPSTAPARCAPGDLWALGEHRLLCADSSDRETVLALLAGERPALGFADPPYGAGVADWDQAFVWNHDYLADLCDVVAVTPGISALKDFMSLTQMPYRWSLAAWMDNGKARGALGFANWLYAAVFSHGSVYRCSGDQFRLHMRAGELDGEYHRGQKPPRFMKWVVELFTEPGEVVLDVFGGAGTTLIACEQTKRRCRMVEIDPRSCDIVLRRWERGTGERAVRL